jgi:hypothetical protein
MSEQEREGTRVPRPEEADVEAHMPYRWNEAGEAVSEPPPDAGERSEESDEADVEGHRAGFRADAEAPEDAGKRSEESDEPGGERQRWF